MRLLSRDNSGYQLISALFLRLLGLIYLAAFASLAVQIIGLAGAEGILPFREQLAAVESEQGLLRFLALPTLFWLSASDWAMQAAAWAGCALAVLLILGGLRRLATVLLFALYLSLFHAGQLFMNFQWDYLLLEAGFLAIFLPSGSRLVIWLYRWLLFRLRFLSGAAKLLSGDPSWAGLTALNFYFETQPLPHVGAWYAHQLPDWLLQAGAGITLFVELVVPFLMFLPRGPRFFAAWATIALQVAILLTSNHNFFNLLTIVLCLFLFDDRAVSRVLPRRVVVALEAEGAPPAGRKRGHQPLFAALALAIGLASLLQMWQVFSRGPLPTIADTTLRWLRPWHVVNNYHVFPVIKTERLEIVLEGSYDGIQWQRYRFKYRPGDPQQRPPWVIPHQPRLDWMFWFVPAGHSLNMGWYDRFLRRLLEGSEPVLDLLESNPFPDAPPRYLRAGLFRYRFTDPTAKAATGDWWRRDFRGPFHPWPAMEHTPAW